MACQSHHKIERYQTFGWGIREEKSRVNKFYRPCIKRGECLYGGYGVSYFGCFLKFLPRFRVAQHLYRVTLKRNMTLSGSLKDELISLLWVFFKEPDQIHGTLQKASQKFSLAIVLFSKNLYSWRPLKIKLLLLTLVHEVVLLHLLLHLHAPFAVAVGCQDSRP